jgi:hypothetical protein
MQPWWQWLWYGCSLLLLLLLLLLLRAARVVCQLYLPGFRAEVHLSLCGYRDVGGGGRSEHAQKL